MLALPLANRNLKPIMCLIYSVINVLHINILVFTVDANRIFF